MFKYSEFRSSCEDFVDDFEFCAPVPQKAKPRYYSLKWKTGLKRLMPKLFRGTDSRKLVTKSNFVMAIYELLDKLKRTALKDHGVVIKSAIVSNPLGR